MIFLYNMQMIFHVWYGSFIIIAVIIVNVDDDETVGTAMYNMNTRRKYVEETVSTKLNIVKYQFKKEKKILKTGTSTKWLTMGVTFRTRDYKYVMIQWSSGFCHQASSYVTGCRINCSLTVLNWKVSSGENYDPLSRTIRWPLNSAHWRGQKYIQLYLHFLLHLQDMVCISQRNNFIIYYIMKCCQYRGLPFINIHAFYACIHTTKKAFTIPFPS